LRDYLRNIGLTLGGGDDPDTSDYAALILAARSRPDYEIIQNMCLRSMQQAIYSPEQSGHFGLSYEHYAHFTSPIRRYPDLLVHRVIRGILHRERYVPEPEDTQVLAGVPAAKREQETWESLGVALSARERRADDASRDVTAWLKCWFVREHVGEVFSGKVSGVASFGVFITLDTLYVEGMVHVSELGSDYFQYNEAMNELRGERTGIRYRLGEPVQVQVSRVDLEARRIEFRLVKGEDFKALKAEIDGGARREPRAKKAAPAKPTALRGMTSHQRRAEAKRAARQATPKAARKPR
jgi:ribonuclease R